MSARRMGGIAAARVQQHQSEEQIAQAAAKAGKAALRSDSAVGRFVESTRFQTFIIVLIVINAILLGLETSDAVTARFGTALTIADQMILGVFIIEIILKLIAYRFRFFTNGWNVFDFIIVAIALVPASEGFAVLRALRILRVLRLVSVVPSMRIIVSALISSLPSMASVVSLLALIFYIAAVMATHLFGETFEQWFGTIGASLYSLFQIMTLESWSMGISRPVMEVHPFAWIFFVTFIIVTGFAVLNLFIGILVSAIEDAKKEMIVGEIDENQKLLIEIKAELADLRAQLRVPGSVSPVSASRQKELPLTELPSSELQDPPESTS